MHDGTVDSDPDTALVTVNVPDPLDVDDDGDGFSENEGDCDDTDPNIFPGASQACYEGPAGTEGVGICQAGTQMCQVDGTFGPCTGQVLPGVEIANNGIDEDCDGTDPECLSSESVACYEGPAGTEGGGICQAGTQTCQADGTFGSCTGQVLPQTEVEDDGIDQDCDGADATSPLPPDPSTVCAGGGPDHSDDGV